MLRIEVVRGAELSDERRAALFEMCNRAYDEVLEPLFETLGDTTHVMGFLDERLVSHALWVTRWLQMGEGPLLRTAFVEMVATDVEFQGRGFASEIMRRLAEEIGEFELGGLSPADTSVYERLGWRYWRGPLAIRGPEGLIPTPDEVAMILVLPRTPPLDWDATLSAEWREGELW